MKSSAIPFIVISVLGLLLAGVAFLSRKTCDGNEGVLYTRRDLTTLISHLDNYRNNGGQGYPTKEQGLSALVERPTTAPRPRDWSQSFPELPTDAWKNPYRYYFPGTKNPKEPEIISAGPDGIFGNEDDLSSQD